MLSADPPALPRPHLMRQSWRDVGFLHWAVDPARVADRYPPGVRPDVRDGVTWVGLVPFRMVGAGFAHGPAVPWAGTFLETNVRLYSVDDAGRRGVLFLSLDTDRAVVVAGARTVFGLPYRWARMRYAERAGVHRYAARLRHPGVRAESRVSLRPGGPAPDGDLERFLTARWGLHVAHLGRTRYIPNAHPAWPLRTAEVLELDDGLMRSVGLGDLAARPPDHVLWSDGVPVSFGMPVVVEAP
ncbi:MAG: DUF2071 domain-containing protein [Pseudonocardiales bacterium]|nr:DUF2071 domain-containing protein [Pseudonocardiales bacterium]